VSLLKKAEQLFLDTRTPVDGPDAFFPAPWLQRDFSGAAPYQRIMH
jgi:hypothetical protein